MQLSVPTSKRQEFIDITSKVQDAVDIKEGICIVYNPHTTAGITINEGADPDVQSDIIRALDKITPDIHYDHMEGNSPAHVKASLMGSSVHVLVKDGKLQLGTWQKIFFCEFDGPRHRKIWLQTLKK